MSNLLIKILLVVLQDQILFENLQGLIGFYGREQGEGETCDQPNLGEVGPASASVGFNMTVANPYYPHYLPGINNQFCDDEVNDYRAGDDRFIFDIGRQYKSP